MTKTPKIRKSKGRQLARTGGNGARGRFSFGSFPIVSFPSPMPRRAFTTLRWSLATNIVVSGAPWVSDAQISLNSINSPNATHQPLGHDQWATLYSRYVVVGADVTVSVVNLTASSSAHVAIVATNSNTGISEPSTAMEQYSGTNLFETGSPGAPPIVFKRRYNLRDIYGVDDETILTDDRYQAIMTADPAEFCFLHIVSSRDGATGYTLAATYNVLYHVVFFDAGQITQN